MRFYLGDLMKFLRCGIFYNCLTLTVFQIIGYWDERVIIKGAQFFYATTTKANYPHSWVMYICDLEILIGLLMHFITKTTF